MLNPLSSRLQRSPLGRQWPPLPKSCRSCSFDIYSIVTQSAWPAVVFCVPPEKRNPARPSHPVSSHFSILSPLLRKQLVASPHTSCSSGPPACLPAFLPVSLSHLFSMYSSYGESSFTSSVGAAAGVGLEGRQRQHHQHQHQSSARSAPEKSSVVGAQR